MMALAMAFASIALAGPVSAQADARLERGIAAHDAALAGDESKVGEALKLLGPEGWDRPPLALAYHGSAITLEAAHAKKTGELMNALGFIDEGAKEIDAAAVLDPQAVAIRLLRIENSVALAESSPVDRKPVAAADIAYLRTRWGELEPEARAIIELDEGRLSLAGKRLGDAMGSWRKAIREAPTSEAAARAKKLLQRYGD
jgi:tetratricopeptide (TPR) repeat protein